MEDENVTKWYEPGTSKEQADKIFLREWTRDFHYRVKLKSEGMESIAGYGTTKDGCSKLISELPRIFKQYNITSVLDAACGDFYYMQYVDLTNINYIGIDFVQEQIDMNKRNYPNYDFRVLNMAADVMPKADLVISRDTLIHISNTNIKRFLKSCYDSGCKYLLTTNFPEVTNQELGGILGWRNVNFDQDPWNFSAVESVSEKNNYNPEKYATLYDFNDIITKI